MPAENPRDEAVAALKQAENAARRGDVAKAERWTKTAERLAASAERVAALPPPTDDDEALRAELRRRLQRYAVADLSFQRWEAERELYEASLFAAIVNGAEPPPALLSAQPFGGENEEVVLTNILLGPEPNDGLVA